MENTKKKNSNMFFKILFILFIMFLCVYSISANGYLERSNANKSLFTEEQIKQFESDVEAGRVVDIDSYLGEKEVDYSNAASNMGEKISNAIDFTANKSIELFNSFFSFLFN